MIRSRMVTGALVAFALMVPVAPGAAQAASGTEPEVSPVAVVSDEISFDGRYVWDEEATQVVDRQTGARSPAPVCTSHWCRSAGFVRDNAALVLTFEYGPRPIPGEDAEDDHWNRGPLTGVYLNDTVTGARWRIDTDSSGAALVPSWQNQQTCGNEWCDNFYDFPDVFVSIDSVSRDGRRVAFCTNYAEAKVPVLYVKDLRKGLLTKTRRRCPIMDYVEGQVTRPPQISADGRVVHVNGDYSYDPDRGDGWGADSLVFTRTGGVRTVNGWGSMTRDGGTIFMRLGVRSAAGGPRTRSAIRVGSYDVKTKRVTRIPGDDRIYGNDVVGMSAFDVASYRGRYVVGLTPVYSLGTYGELRDVRVAVVDRRSGATTDLVALLRERGYEPFQSDWDPAISGDGKVVIVQVQTGDPALREQVAITGWEPTARAAVSSNAAGSKLVVNVDPDKGSGYWTFRVQVQRPDGSWRTLKAKYRTQGTRETRTINLPAGTYRIVVKAKYGYRGTTSAPVTLAA